MDGNTNEDVIYSTFVRTEPFEEGSPTKSLSEIDPNIECEEMRGEHMVDIAMYERVYEMDGHCTEFIHMIGENGEILVGTGLTFNEIFERSEGKITREDLRNLGNQLLDRCVNKKKRTFLFGKGKTEEEIMREIRSETIRNFSRKLSEKIARK